MPEIVDDYNFVRLNGRTFTITEVNFPTLDRLVEEIKTTNTERVAALTRDLRTEFVREASQLAHNEHTRILRDVASTGVSVPNEMQGLPFTVIRGVLCPIRVVLFRTERVYGSVYAWYNKVSMSALWERINAAVGRNVQTDVEIRQRSAEWKISITGTPHITHQTSVMYAMYGDKLCMSKQMWHTLGRETENGTFNWYRMCIGNAVAPTYWALNVEEFSKQVSEFNLDSPATTSVTFDGRTSVGLLRLIDGMTDVNIRLVSPSERWS